VKRVFLWRLPVVKIVYRAADILEAHIVAGMLQSQGIDAHVGGHYLQGAVGDLAMQGFANVQVQDDEFEAAQFHVADYESARSEDDSAEESRQPQQDGEPWLA